MCLSLHPLNPGSVKTKPEEVTTNLEVLRLQTPKVIAYVLYDLMTGAQLQPAQPALTRWDDRA